MPASRTASCLCHPSATKPALLLRRLSLFLHCQLTQLNGCLLRGGHLCPIFFLPLVNQELFNIFVSVVYVTRILFSLPWYLWVKHLILFLSLLFASKLSYDLFL